MALNKPIKVKKAAEIKKVEVSPADVVKSVMVRYKRRMRSLEAEMLRELAQVLQTLKS